MSKKMKLIDQQAAINAVDVRNLHRGIVDALQDIISELPTADAVEVVRCGECKHCYVDGENVRYNVCDLNHNKVQADDWFCADAEKRKNEERKVEA